MRHIKDDINEYRSLITSARGAEGDGEREGEAEPRDPTKAFGDIAGKIAGAEGAKARALGIGIAVAAVLLVGWSVATAGFGEGAESTAGEGTGTVAEADAESDDLAAQELAASQAGEVSVGLTEELSEAVGAACAAQMAGALESWGDSHGYPDLAARCKVVAESIETDGNGNKAMRVSVSGGEPGALEVSWDKASGSYMIEAA